MRFDEYFICDSCGVHLARNPKDLYNCINISYCPKCGELLRERTEISDQKYSHAVISSLVISSKQFDDLLINIENCVKEYNRKTLINESGREYLLQKWKKLARDIRNENYEEMDLSFLDKPEKEKIKGMIRDVEEETESSDLESEFDYVKGNEQDESDTSTEVKPTKHLIEDYLGICDVLFLGTGHDAPILDSLINEMEENYVDIVMIESGIGQSSIDKDASVGNKAAHMYDNMYDHAESYLLKGTPDSLREIAENGGYSSFTKEEGWMEDDHETFKNKNRMLKMVDEEYYEAIISERNGKFAMEAVGYITENRGRINGNACIIAGKSHITGIYKRMTGLEL